MMEEQSGENFLVNDLFSNVTLRFKPDEEDANETNDCFEANPMEYDIGGIEAKCPEKAIAYKRGKLPHIAVHLYMSDSQKIVVNALWDTGCTASLLSQKFVNTFPEVLKQSIKKEYCN